MRGNNVVFIRVALEQKASKRQANSKHFGAEGKILVFEMMDSDASPCDKN